PSQEYYFAVFEYNGDATNTFYLTDAFLANNGTTVSAPTDQASDLTFSNITGTSMTVNWTSGNGSGRILVGKAGSAVDFDPVDLTYYPYYNSGFYNSYYDLGNGNFSLYASSGNSVTIYNLKPGETYHFEV